MKKATEAKKRYVKPEVRRIRLDVREGILACREADGTDKSPYDPSMCALSLCFSASV